MRPIALAALATTFLAHAALAGPPWISVEIRARHGGQDPWMIVRTFHHGTPVGYPLRGSAVAVIAGRRTVYPLRFEPLPDEGNAYQIPVVWTAGTPWVLNLALVDEHMGAGAVIGIGADGDAAFVRYPRTLEGITRAATDREVDTLLQALAAGREPPPLGRGSVAGFVLRNRAPVATLAGLSLGLMVVGAWATRRSQARRSGPNPTA